MERNFALGLVYLAVAGIVYCLIRFAVWMAVAAFCWIRRKVGCWLVTRDVNRDTAKVTREWLAENEARAGLLRK